jgi:hypothetical protein
LDRDQNSLIRAERRGLRRYGFADKQVWAQRVVSGVDTPAIFDPSDMFSILWRGL